MNRFIANCPPKFDLADEHELRSVFLHYTRRLDWMFTLASSGEFKKRAMKVVDAYRLANVVYYDYIQFDFQDSLFRAGEEHFRSLEANGVNVEAMLEDVNAEIFFMILLNGGDADLAVASFFLHQRENQVGLEMMDFLSQFRAVYSVLIGSFFRTAFGYRGMFNLLPSFYSPNNPMYFMHYCSMLVKSLGLEKKEAIDLIAHLWLMPEGLKDVIFCTTPKTLLILLRAGKLLQSFLSGEADDLGLSLCQTSFTYVSFISSFCSFVITDALHDVLTLNLREYVNLQCERSYVHKFFREVSPVISNSFTNLLTVDFSSFDSLFVRAEP